MVVYTDTTYIIVLIVSNSVIIQIQGNIWSAERGLIDDFFKSISPDGIIANTDSSKCLLEINT